MGANAPNLTAEERTQLKQFVRLVHDMLHSRFIERVKVQDHSIKSERLENGQYLITVPDYDWEDFRSFLTAFRQVAMSERDTVYLTRIRNIVARHGSELVRGELAKLKSRIIPIIEGRLTGIRFGHNVPGEDISFTSFELLEALVNGLVFHSDSDHDRAVSLILSSEPWQYIWVILTEIVLPVLRACAWLVNVIRIEGYLDEADFPTTEGPA